MKQIAWLGRVEVGADGADEYVIEREGMTRDEIREAFPPHWNSKTHGMTFERKKLIKAVIQEAYQEAQETGIIERMNVRGFWYKRLLYTLRTVAGDTGTQDAIDSTINEAWGELVEARLITYNEMGIYSDKSKEYHVAVKEKSPYPTVVVLVEKKDYFGDVRDLADVNPIAVVATGGQNSRCAALDYLDQLVAVGIDLDQEFTVFSFCDFDPEGWDIPESFIDHLRGRITADIRLIRLGLLKSQISKSVLQYQATPYEPKNAKRASAIKAAETKYARFAAETGGICMPGTNKSARVELDMYTGAQIRDKIIDGLSQHVDGFAYQVEQLKEMLRDEYEEGYFPHDGPGESVHEVYEPYHDAISEMYDHLGLESLKIAPVERARIRELEKEIRQLEAVIEDKTSGIDRQMSALTRLHGELEEEAETEIEELAAAPSLGDCTFASLKDAIKHIEENGGWQSWADEVGIRIVKSEDLADCARQRRAYHWHPDHGELGYIRDWIEENLIPETSYGDPDGPDESLEQLIGRTLGEA